MCIAHARAWHSHRPGCVTNQVSDATLELVGSQFECSAVGKSTEAQAIDAEQFHIASAHLVEAEIAELSAKSNGSNYERGATLALTPNPNPTLTP